MVQIQRIINGNNVTITLTEEEIQKVRRQDNIQWAKDILVNYEEIIVDYDNIIQDEEKLLAFAECLDEKNLEDNGEKEIEAIKELFETYD